MDKTNNLNFRDKLVQKDVANFIVVKEIVNVVPVKWDGIESDYIICEQSKAESMAIVITDEDNKNLYMLLPIGKVKNTYLLVDAIMEDK